MKIAFVGTGTMGGPMLANLVKKSFAVTAYDVVPAALDRAVKAGASAAGSAADAARGAYLIVTMLPSSSHVEAAYLEDPAKREALREEFLSGRDEEAKKNCERLLRRLTDDPGLSRLLPRVR